MTMAEPSAPTPSPAPRSLRRILASIVLAFETIVVFLAALVIWGLSRGTEGLFGLPEWTPLVVGGIVILGLVVTMALLRFEWAYLLGWALQGLILLSGLVNPAMYVVGAVFGGMWVYCMIVGGRIDRERAAAVDPGKEQA
jgi:hypothetical protein